MSFTKDRLNELLQKQNSDIGSDNKTENSSNGNTITQTFANANVIRENIEQIRHNTVEANDILKNNVFQINKGLQDRLDSLFRTNASTAYKINSSLQQLEKDLTKAKNEASAEYRIKKVQLLTLKQEFRDALKESSDSLEYHKNKRRELLKKSLKTTRQSVNEEELETLLDENKLDVFTNNVLITTEEARRQLLDIEERHKELLKIEKHLNEILDLFVKVATLVEQQQESVNRVEYYAATATDFVEHGTNELGKGARSEKKYRKRKIYIILVAIIIILSLIIFFIV